jgi:uncharacterized protein (TIGR02246 family)
MLDVRRGFLRKLKPEETMKIRTVVTFVGLAISFALPISAQQNTVDPEVRQQIEAVLRQFDEAFNKHDAAAIAALFTPEAVEMFPFEAPTTISGQQAIQKRYEAEASESSASNMTHKLVQVYPVGDDICAFTDYSVMMWKGHSLAIYVRDADTWKIRMTYNAGR